MPLSDGMKAVMLAAAESNLADGAEIHLHTGDPGAAGTANVLTPGNGYSHPTGVAFSVVGSDVENDSAVALGVRTGGGDVTLTHFSVWLSDGTTLRATGALTSSYSYEVGETPPNFAPGALVAVRLSDPA